MSSYLWTNSLHVPRQSAYRDFYSTETALLKVENDICFYLTLKTLDATKALITTDYLKKWSDNVENYLKLDVVPMCNSVVDIWW